MHIEKILKAVANKRRLKILKHLDSHGLSHVGSISRAIGLSMKATSKHLQILSSVDLVTKEQKSLFVYYDLSSAVPIYIAQILEDL